MLQPPERYAERAAPIIVPTTSIHCQSMVGVIFL